MNQEKIEQYVAGRLGNEEAEAFEAYCVANPEFARQVEFEQRLRDGIREVAAGSTAEFVRANNPMRWKVARPSRTFAPAPSSCASRWPDCASRIRTT